MSRKMIHVPGQPERLSIEFSHFTLERIERAKQAKSLQSRGSVLLLALDFVQDYLMEKSEAHDTLYLEDGQIHVNVPSLRDYIPLMQASSQEKQEIVFLVAQDKYCRLQKTASCFGFGDVEECVACMIEYYLWICELLRPGGDLLLAHGDVVKLRFPHMMFL